MWKGKLPLVLLLGGRHWQVPLSRRFRSLKLWFVLRSYGIEGLQKHIREGVRLAQKFEELVNQDSRFEIPAKRHLGLVVFRLKGENDLTELLLKRLNQSGKIHAVPASIKGKYIIRFTVTSMHTTEADIQRDWSIICILARRVLVDLGKEEEVKIQQMPTEEELEIITIAPMSNIGLKRREGMKRRDYGLSLILSNVPMSPKFIDGSFAALFENTESITEYAKHLSRRSIDFNGQPIRLSPRKRLSKNSKQYSFDLSRPPQNQKSFAPPQRQNSLDSKIEEIIDISLVEAARNGDHDDDDTLADFQMASSSGIQTEDKAVQSPTSPELEEIDLYSVANKGIYGLNRINGQDPTACKHCGRAVED